jgi:hypothetical protein
MKRIAIDTMIVDYIADSSGLADKIRAAGKTGKFIIIRTPMVRNQLEAIFDQARRAFLL